MQSESLNKCARRHILASVYDNGFILSASLWAALFFLDRVKTKQYTVNSRFMDRWIVDEVPVWNVIISCNLKPCYWIVLCLPPCLPAWICHLHSQVLCLCVLYTLLAADLWKNASALLCYCSGAAMPGPCMNEDRGFKKKKKRERKKSYAAEFGARCSFYFTDDVRTF